MARTEYLLDTHVLFWWMSTPKRLPGEVRELIGDGSGAIWFSVAGAWEMAIKKTLGRLDYPPNLADVLGKDHIEILPVRLEHALGVAYLPLIHQDPFDRLLLAQARIEGLTIITADRQIARYDVSVVKV